MNNSQRICRVFSFFLGNFYINFVLCSVLTFPTLNPTSHTEYTHECIGIGFRRTVMITSFRVLGINSLNSIKENNLKIYINRIIVENYYFPNQCSSLDRCEVENCKKIYQKDKRRRDEGCLNWNHFSCCVVEDGMEMSEIWEAEESKI